MILSALLLATSPLLGGDPNYFPLAVWLQSPANAESYQKIGINLYVGLWQGPTEEQISALEKAKMPVVCEMNDWARQHLNRKIIAGWMHQDEPDNAQALPDGKGYGPPISPEKVVEGYRDLKRTDPTRPVLLNLGQGVAWDDWIGRGVRSRHPEDYPLYTKGCDIASFDIYPVTSPPPVQGDLGYVGRGMARLRGWTRADQRVWACIEATHVGNASAKPTPEQTRQIVWQAIVHGAQGLIYFSHQFAPRFIEAGILADPEMRDGVRKTNAEVKELAPILNAPVARDSVRATGPIDFLVKVKGESRYVFAVSMSAKEADAAFETEGRTAEVLYENRKIALEKGAFRDHFDPYAVHLYRVRP